MNNIARSVRVMIASGLGLSLGVLVVSAFAETSDATSAPATSASQSSETPTNSHAGVLQLDASLYGSVDFTSPDGSPLSLVILDTSSGAVLLSKSYQDGRIAERLDFGGFRLPLEQIRVLYRDARNVILKQLTPVAPRERMASSKPPVSWDCRTASYPCTWNDADPEVLSRSINLLNLGATMLAEGRDVDEVADHLGGLPDVVEVQADPVAVEFRLTDAPPVVLMTELAGPLPGGESEDLSSLRERLYTWLRSRSSVISLAMAAAPLHGPAVCQDPCRGNFASVGKPGKSKQQVLLGPFDSKEGRPTGKLERLFREQKQYPNRGYAPDGGTLAEMDWATELANTDSLGVLHINSHANENTITGVSAEGKYLESTMASIVEGRITHAENLGDEMSHYLREGVTLPKGVTFGRPAGIAAPPHLSYSSNYFNDATINGVGNAIAFLNGCRSGAGDLAQAVHGSGGATVIGWSNYAWINHADSAALEFWKLMLEQGIDTHSAYCDMQRRGLTQHKGWYEGSSHTTELVILGPPRRARDVVSALDEDNASLADGGTIEVHPGKTAGEDTLDVTVEIEAVLKGTENKIEVSAIVDGQELPGVFKVQDDGSNGGATKEWSTKKLTGSVKFPGPRCAEDSPKHHEVELRASLKGCKGYSALRTLDVRLEEPWVVELIHPEFGAQLSDGDRLKFKGKKKDGKHDELPIIVQVRENDAAWEANMPWTVEVWADDKVKEVPKNEFAVAAKGLYRWKKRLPLRFDVTDGRDTVALEAVLTVAQEERSCPDSATVKLIDDELETGWEISVGGGAHTGTYEGKIARAWHMAGNDQELRVVIRAEPDDPRYVQWAVYTDGRISGPGSYPLARCNSDLLFVVIGKSTELKDFDSMCSGDGTPSGTAPGVNYPPPSILTITEMTDEWVEGSVIGEHYSQGGPWARPELTAPVRVRFRAARCGVWGRNKCPGEE